MAQANTSTDYGDDLVQEAKQKLKYAPETLEKIYQRVAKEKGVPVGLLRGIGGAESSQWTDLRPSQYGNLGGMQLSPELMKRYGVTDPYDPEQAIPAAAEYLKEGAGEKGDWERGLKYYYAGPDQRDWGPKTQQYPGTVLSKSAPQVPQGDYSDDLLNEAKELNKAKTSAGTQAPIDVGGGSTVRLGPELPWENTPPPVQPTPEPFVGAHHYTQPTQGFYTPWESAYPPDPNEPPPGVDANYWRQNLHGPNWADAENAPGSNPWGFGTDVANKAALGLGLPIAAALRSAVGVGPYRAAMSRGQAMQQQYASENPHTALATSILAPIPATVLGMGLVGRAAGAGAEAVGQAVPQAAPAINALTRFASGTGQTSVPGRIGSYLTQGAIQGAGAGAMQNAMTDNNVGHDALVGAGLGAASNLIAGPLGHFANGYVNAVVRPEIAALTQTPVGKAVGLTAEDITQHQLPTSTQFRLSMHESDPGKLERWANQANLAAGGPGGAMGQADMQGIKANLGNIYQANQHRWGFDPGLPDPTTGKSLVDQLADMESDVVNRFGLRGRAPAGPGGVNSPTATQMLNTLDGVMNDIYQAPPGGIVPGDRYRTAVRFGGEISDLMNNGDPAVRRFGAQLKQALDDAVERTAIARNDPTAVALLRDTNQKYKAAMVLNKLVAKEPANSGIPNPKGLQPLVREAYSDYGWNPNGQLDDLAQVGSLLTKPNAQGGVTGQARHWVGPLATGGAAAIAAHEAGLGVPYVAAAAGAGLGYEAARHQLGRFLTSDMLTNHLVNMAQGRAGPWSTNVPIQLLPQMAPKFYPQQRNDTP